MMESEFNCPGSGEHRGAPPVHLYAAQDRSPRTTIREQLDALYAQVAESALEETIYVWFDVIEGREAEGLNDVLAFCQANPRSPSQPGYVALPAYIGLRWAVPGQSADERHHNVAKRLQSSGWSILALDEHPVTETSSEGSSDCE